MTRHPYKPIVELAHPGISGSPLATRCEMLLLRDKATIAMSRLPRPNIVSYGQYGAVVEIVTNWWAMPMEDDALKSFYRGARAMWDAAEECEKIHVTITKGLDRSVTGD